MKPSRSHCRRITVANQSIGVAKKTTNVRDVDGILGLGRQSPCSSLVDPLD